MKQNGLACIVGIKESFYTFEKIALYETIK